MLRKIVIACFLLTTTIFAQDIRVKYKTLQLSYMTTDRVGGVLKSLGYAVVDFEKSPGVNPNESILTPTGDFADVLINGMVSEEDYDVLPLVILLPETDNVTLLEMQGAVSEKGAEMGVDLGGSSLVFSTSGEPLQRLLIAYDPDNSEDLKELVSVIANQLDVAAKQIMIEALVVEIDANKTNTLGVNFANSGSMYSSSFPEPDPSTGNFEPFTFIMDKGLIGNALEINAKLEKLISDQSSEILSRPSVLVLDGRQARIVVGQQIPIARSTATGQNVVSATEYIPIGIVLNLRPRISSDGNEITMQVETIISEAQERVGVGSVGGDVLSAPTFSSRKVQTYVQVENNTPFIIGGLISHKDSKQENEFPILGRIPILGGLLGFNKKVRSNKEVIVVITPHIVDVGTGSFSHVIPKDIDILNHWGNKLFQDSYRLRNTDLYDLGFFENTSFYNNVLNRAENIIQESAVASSNEELTNFVNGSVPGEGVLIRRMLYDVIEKENYYKHIQPEKVIFFGKISDNKGNAVVDMQNFGEIYRSYLKRFKQSDGLALQFESTESVEFADDYPLRPVANINRYESSGSYKNTLRDLNSDSTFGYSIYLTQPKHERRLYEALVLRRVLEMNPDIQDNINLFKAGREILFPAPESLEGDIHVIDNKIAKYFYQINLFNDEFDKEFVKGIEEISSIIQQYE